MLRNLTRRVFTMKSDSPDRTRDDINETDIDSIRKFEIFPSKNREHLSQEDIDALYQMGFSLGDILTCWKIHKFIDVEEAIHYLMIDSQQEEYQKHQTEPYCNSEKLDLNRKIRKKKSNNDDFNFQITRRESDAVNMNSNNINNNYTLIRVTQNNETASRNIKTSVISSSNSLISLYKNEIIENIRKRNNDIISKIDINSFNTPNLCQICYDNTTNDNNMNFSCGHNFYCKSCLNQYLINKIKNNNVLNIKCLYIECNRTFTQDEVKSIVSASMFNKYKYYLNKKTFFSLNKNKTIIYCPYPDCDEIITMDSPINDKNNKIICRSGHKFCGKCRQLSWHTTNYCTDYTEIIMKKLQRSRYRNKIKLCPHCKVVIEKKKKSNKVTCTNCSFKFCWLCLDKCEENHFAIYNITGCYGKKNITQEEIDNKTKCNNFCCCLLTFSAMLGVILFYLVLGCGAELMRLYIRCVMKKLPKGVDEENDGDILSGNCCKNLTGCQSLICILLFICGLCLQPLYLTVYILMLLIHCMKTIGCGMFLYIMNNH